MERSDRHPAFGHRFKICTALVHVAEIVVVDVVLLAATFGLAILHLVAVHPLAQGGELHALDLAGRAVGAVDVEEGLRREALRESGRDQPVSDPGRNHEIVSGDVPLRRHRDRRDVQHDAFERGGHGARIGDVVAQVHTQIDARDDDVGPAIEQPQRGHAHAVDRSAVGGVGEGAVGQAPLPPPQRRVHGDAAGRARPVLVGRHDAHLTQRVEGGLERGQSG